VAPVIVASPRHFAGAIRLGVRLDQADRGDRVMPLGTRQRRAFARLPLHRPRLMLRRAG
jgi:ABC-type uncharacterized transport system fused permease/ATPase subunit